MKVQIAGMAWFRPDTYVQLRAMFEDGDKLHRTYNEWFAAAESFRKSQERLGVRIICVDIDPDNFPKWCAENGYKVNSDARKRYASSVAAEFVKSGL